MEGNGEFDRIEVLALDVFDDREFENLFIISGAEDYGDLRKLRGTYRFSRTMAEIKEDR